MADFTALKTAIQNAIKQNGNEEITGNLLQEVLLAIVTTLGDGSINDLVTALGSEATTRSQADGTLQQNIEAEAQARQQAVSAEAQARQLADTTLQQNIDAEATTRGQADTALGGRIDGVVSSIEAINNAIENGYVYAGIATPSSTPASGKVFYLALTAGTYTNFGDIAVTQGINMLKYNGSTWSLDSFVGIDDAPAPSSQKLVKSGGVFDEVMKNGSAFDLSAYNGGATYADLNAALTALNALPAAYKRGGMSMKFVLSSDNKYIQYRLMSDTWSVDIEDWAIAEEGVYVENPEFVYIKADAEGKILWAIKTDGGIYYGAGVPQQVIDYIEEKIADLSLDEYEDIVAFLGSLIEGDTLATLLNAKANTAEMNAALDTKVDKVTGKSLIDADYASSLSAIENNEYLELTTDNQDNIIDGIKKDGSHYIFNVQSETIDALNREVDNKVNKEIGKGLSSNDYTNADKEVVAVQKLVDNPEYTEVNTDSENKVLSGRNSDGAAFESVGFSTPYIATEQLRLSDSGLNELIGQLKDAGGAGVNEIDWSNAKSLHIKEPYCAKVNISGTYYIPTSKSDNLHAYLEFWDMNGNYFKKEIILNAQGNSSMAHPKKNMSIDICNNNGWDDDDTFSLQIGSWVPQDSFHLKAFYNDPFRCICPISYKLYDKIVKTRGELDDYVWKRACLDLASVTATSNGSSTAADTEAQYNDGARCFPDGFPCIVYLNGEFYGIYSWQLKKHRDNYHMKKNKAKHIHLDGIINDTTLWNGVIDWTQFEIRNPKSLKTVDGNKYDGDNPTEITGDPSVDATTAEVKGYIEDFSLIKPTITTAFGVYEASSKTASDKETFKQVFEQYFDAISLIDYIIFSDISNNYDGFNKNWQWITYDGVKWYCVPYDCDGLFGNHWQLNDTIHAPLTDHLTIEGQPGAVIGATWMIDPIYSVYQDELESRYKELRDSHIISTQEIVGSIVSWLDRVGNKETFKKEWEKWPDFIKNDSIHRVYKWVQESIGNMDSVYNYNQN